MPRQVNVPKIAQALKVEPARLLEGSDVIDATSANAAIVRAEKATLKEIRDEVKKLNASSAPPVVVAPVQPLHAVAIPSEDEAIVNPDRMLADIIDAWANAKPAARLVAALLITEDWSYRLKLWNREISVDENLLKTLRRIV